jgi:HPt (histidine-containing phosphotransfer) domain-containing protein
VANLLAVIDARAKPADAHEGPAAAPEELLLDPTRVAELLRLDSTGEAFRSLSVIALDEASRHVGAIAGAAEGADAASAAAAAHGLRSSAAVFGADRLGRLAAAIEQQARAGATPNADTVAELHLTLQATKDAVAGVDQGD